MNSSLENDKPKIIVSGLHRYLQMVIIDKRLYKQITKRGMRDTGYILEEKISSHILISHSLIYSTPMYSYMPDTVLSKCGQDEKYTVLSSRSSESNRARWTYKQVIVMKCSNW